MQDDVVPGQARVDWWLGKTAEQRAAYMQDATTTDATRAELRALEAYCLSHSYEVYCLSALRPRPFAPHILQPSAAIGTEDGGSVAGADNGVPQSASPLLWANISGETGGVCGRQCFGVHETAEATTGNNTNDNATTASAAAAQAAAKARLLAVVQHVDDYLARQCGPCAEAASEAASDTSYSVAPRTRRALAGLVVQLLLEAAVAASYRDGVAERLERAQYVAQMRQAKARAAADADAVRAQANRRTSGGSRSTSMMRDSEEDEEYKAHEEVHTVVAVRPVTVALREAQALASLWLLLAPHRAAGVATSAAPHAQNGWSTLRAEAMAALHARRAQREAAAAAAQEQNSEAEPRKRLLEASASTATVPPSRPVVRITAQDMRFAIEKLLASPPAAALCRERNVGLVVPGRRILRFRPLSS